MSLMRSFDDLPPRIVVFEILSFYSLQIHSFVADNPNQIYYLFGFFKRDKLRNIWYLFPSIEYVGRINRFVAFPQWNCESAARVSFRRNFCIEVNLGTLNEESSVLLKSISCHSSRMLQLRKLAVIFKTDGKFATEVNESVRSHVSSFFRDSNAFPKLESLSLKILDNDFEVLNNWTDGISFFTIRELSLDTSSNHKRLEAIPKLFKEGYFQKFQKNLTVLRLRLFFFNNEVKIKLPNLNELYLFGVSKLHVLTASLNVLKCEVTRSEYFFDNIKNSRNLKTLILKEVDFNTKHLPLLKDLILEESKFKQLRHLHLEKLNLDQLLLGASGDEFAILETLQLQECSGNSTFQKFKFCKLKSLVLYRSDVANNILEMSFPKLEILDSNGNTISGEYKKNDDPPFPNLLSLRLTCVKFDERIMREFESFRKLEELVIVSCDSESITFENWVSLNNLRTLRFTNQFVKDRFFQEQKLERLERLELDKLYITKYEGWNYINGGTKKAKRVFPNLKELIISQEYSLSDGFFQENEFPALEKVSFRCLNITGKGWNEVNKKRFQYLMNSKEGDELKRIKISVVSCPYFELSNIF